MTEQWSAKIAAFDGFVFVTAKYYHSIPAALKNGIDLLYVEWNNKAAGFVGYGNTGGARAIEHLRAVMAELQVADVRAQVGLSLFTDFMAFSEFAPAAQRESELTIVLDQVVSWANALATLRVAAEATPTTGIPAQVPAPH